MAAALAIIFGVLYLLGGRRAVRLLDARPRWTSRHWRGLAFYVGLVLVAVGVSPQVDALVRTSMATRTAQLVARLMVVGPLLVLGAPEPRFRRLLLGRTRPVRRPLAVPMLAFVLFNGGIMLAYLPTVYRVTAGTGWPRELGQITMLALAYFFWSQVIAQPPADCRLPHLGRVVYLFLSSAQLRVLGVILGFAASAFYPVPLVDQQIAAGILMVPGVLTDLIVLTVCLYLWLGQDERRRTTLGRQALTGSS
jgi:cytochrome c oxidase assembly factor CtaG